MTTRRNLLILLSAVGATQLTGCRLQELHDAYRYKITVEVETPQGLRTGSAVREVVYAKQPIRLPHSTAVVTTQLGPLVAVNLPNGQVLQALLSADGYDTLQAAFGDDRPATLDTARSDRRIVELHPKPNSIPEQSGYPMLLTFVDPDDPASLQRVDPANLAASFGPGVRLRRITVQIMR